MRLLVLLAGALVARAQAPHVKLEDPAVIAKGNDMFAKSCGVGYCHGKEGGAGRAPRLAGRKWDRDSLFQTTANGLPDKGMPPFKTQLTAAEIWSVVAYILSLSGGGAPVPQPAQPSAAPTPRTVPGDPAAGRAIFFDASNPKRCAACHRFQGRGADVGPDLTSVTARAADEILRDILEPDARLALGPLTVVTKSGEQVTGVKKQEAADLLRIYDTSTIPPVLRTIYKDQIAGVTPERRSPMPADYGRTLTRRQLEDLVAFLKSAPE